MADFVNHTGDPVFETTLNQALVVQLGQSPVLDIVSSQHLRQSLQYLGKKPDDAITPAIAREIGEREGIKAILTGTIANLGSDYIITLSAQNTATGDQIASVQDDVMLSVDFLDADRVGKCAVVEKHYAAARRYARWRVVVQASFCPVVALYQKRVVGRRGREYVRRGRPHNWHWHCRFGRHHRV